MIPICAAHTDTLHSSSPTSEHKSSGGLCQDTRNFLHRGTKAQRAAQNGAREEPPAPIPAHTSWLKKSFLLWNDSSSHHSVTEYDRDLQHHLFNSHYSLTSNNCFLKFLLIKSKCLDILFPGYNLNLRQFQNYVITIPLQNSSMVYTLQVLG